jgi:hypothetical protein
MQLQMRLPARKLETKGPNTMPMRLHLTEVQTYALRAALRTHAADASTALKFASLRANTAEAADARSSKAKQYRELADIATRLGSDYSGTQFRQMAEELDEMSAAAQRSTPEDNNGTRFDYDRQAWIVDGRYQRCGHPDTMACDCYGRLHAGELAPKPEPVHSATCATLTHGDVCKCTCGAEPNDTPTYTL